MREINGKRVTTHGRSRTPEHNVWHNMLQRCFNVNDTSYDNYGGRGIMVCKGWLAFENFFEDMGKRPDGLTLERKNNELGYFKENCEWATRLAQSRNQRLRKANKTGATGVRWCKKRKRFIATIRVPGKKIHLGCFKNIDNAILARQNGEKKYWNIQK